MKFRELILEADKMRTNNGFEYPIPKVKKVQKYADTLKMSDSRIVAGLILDWCKLNKVKVEEVIKMSAEDDNVAKLARKVFMGKDMRKNTPASKELKALFAKGLSEAGNKIKFTMCPNCNEQNPIKIDPKKNKSNYLCENCKKGYKGSYVENGKLMKG